RQPADRRRVPSEGEGLFPGRRVPDLDFSPVIVATRGRQALAVRTEGQAVDVAGVAPELAHLPTRPEVPDLHLPAILALTTPRDEVVAVGAERDAPGAQVSVPLPGKDFSTRRHVPGLDGVPSADRQALAVWMEGHVAEVAGPRVPGERLLPRPGVPNLDDPRTGGGQAPAVRADRQGTGARVPEGGRLARAGQAPDLDRPVLAGRGDLLADGGEYR